MRNIVPYTLPEETSRLQQRHFKEFRNSADNKTLCFVTL